MGIIAIIFSAPASPLPLHGECRRDRRPEGESQRVGDLLQLDELLRIKGSLFCFFRRRKQIAPTALAPLRSKNFTLYSLHFTLYTTLTPHADTYPFWCKAQSPKRTRCSHVSSMHATVPSCRQETCHDYCEAPATQLR